MPVQLMGVTSVSHKPVVCSITCEHIPMKLRIFVQIVEDNSVILVCSTLTPLYTQGYVVIAVMTVEHCLQLLVISVDMNVFIQVNSHSPAPSVTCVSSSVGVYAVMKRPCICVNDLGCVAYVTKHLQSLETSELTCGHILAKNRTRALFVVSASPSQAQ